VEVNNNSINNSDIIKGYIVLIIKMITITDYIVYYLNNISDKDKRKIIGNLYMSSNDLCLNDVDVLFNKLLLMSPEELSKTQQYQTIKRVWWLESGSCGVGTFVCNKFTTITDDEITSLISLIVQNSDLYSDGVVLPEDWLRSKYERYRSKPCDINHESELIFFAEYFGYFDTIMVNNST